MPAIPARRCSAPASPATRSRPTKATRRGRALPAFSAGASPRCRATAIQKRSSTWTSCGRRRRWRKCSKSAPRPTRPAPRCRSRRSVQPRTARRWWNFSARRRTRSDLRIALLLALAQIVVGGAHFRTLRRAEGIELLLRHHVDPAICAHLDDVEPLLAVLEHPMLAFQFGDHAFDRAFDAERFAAADALERLFLLDNAAHGSGATEINLRF